MPESFAGEFRNGVIVFEGSPPPLPDGTKVRIEVSDRPAPGSGPEGGDADPMAATRAYLLAAAEEAEANAPPLPPDLAEHHDFYARGKPRP